jgi:hypothetical protein
MDHPFYEFTDNENSFRFEFVSIGKTVIPKAVIFQPLPVADFYNLAMGDVDDDGDIDVFSRSNNGDIEMVLATVVQIVLQFLHSRPESTIFIEGSTPVRIRLYQIAIERELQNLRERFMIAGLYEGEFELFRRNVNYTVLVISLKKS